MKDMILGSLCAATIAAPTSGLVAAQEAQPAAEPEQVSRPFSFTIGSALEYDSNVAVLELDRSAGVGDASMQLELGVGYDRNASGRLDFQAAYNFSEKSHEDFDTFDLRIHRASSTLSYDLEPLDVGVNLQHAYAELDGREFMTLTQASPYVSKLVGRRLFLRFAYTKSDKDFRGNPGRAASADGLSSDVYVFLNGLRTYLVFGYRHDNEDARAAEFDYTGNRLRAQLTRRTTVRSRDVTFRAALRGEVRDYRRVTPSIGERREDERLQFEVTAEVPLGKRIRTRIGYERADNRSNLPSIDFDEDIFSVGFVAEL